MNRVAVAGGVRMDLGDVDVGGVGKFAGWIVAGLLALGKAAAWILNFRGTRAEHRAARLERWEAALNQRDKEYRAELEGRIAKLEALDVEKDQRIRHLLNRMRSMRHSLVEVTVELRDHNPLSQALARATEHLREAYPLTETPDDLADLAAQLRDGDGE